MTYTKFFEILREILSITNPKAVAIFGSRIKGKSGKFSDVDVLVITQNFQDAEKLGIVEKKIRNVEIHAIPINSALELVHNQDPFFVQILNECKPIYGEFYIKFLREVAENVRKSKSVVGKSKS